MPLTIQAACASHKGKVRSRNEDNFYFDEKCMEQVHDNLRNPTFFEKPLRSGLCMAVFDGMGGENFGECASFAAARRMQRMHRFFADYCIPEKQYLLRITQHMDDAVRQAQEEVKTERMGTTLACLYFSGRYAYCCNLGDSRVYRLRDREFAQLSEDHVERRPGDDRQKAPLSRYLGYGSDDIQPDPHIAKGEVKDGDMYLLCSDGLTDMLTNFEIANILLNQTDPERCVRALIDGALEKGGRDNITVIVSKIL